jgi:PilZ domain
LAGRIFERKKRRMPCDVIYEGQHHNGLVLDVSPGGMYIQTSANASIGDRLDVVVGLPGEPHDTRMQVEVARRFVVPARLITVAHGGIGVRILGAPEAYYRFMESLGVGADPGKFTSKKGKASRESKAREKAQAAKPPQPRFRVRVKQRKGPRSRVLELAADSEEEAASDALVQLGEGWTVIGVAPLAER